MSENKKQTYSKNTLPVLLREPRILLIGAGTVAYEKAEVLYRNHITFSVIASEILSPIQDLVQGTSIKKIEACDLQGYNIIIDATGNDEVGELLKKEKLKRFFLLNRVDIPSDCDFYFSALIEYGNLKVAVSSNGGSPTLAKKVRDRIKTILPNDLNSLSDNLMAEREAGIIDIPGSKKKVNKLFGKVYLVGCGLGDPDFLTVKAYKVIKLAEVVLYDYLITNQLLELIPTTAEKIFVGKLEGGHHTNQGHINKLLEKYAIQGLSVVRLKSGDPYIFGRGAEEAKYLLDRDIQVEVIPGVSSALGGPLMAGIPPTARGYAANLSIVSGCLQKHKTNFDWLSLLKIPNHTTIVLMGLKKLDAIVNKALSEGIDKYLPAAIISNAGRDNQKVITTSLLHLPEASLSAKKPAILVFGEVVKLSEHLPKYINSHVHLDTIT